MEYGELSTIDYDPKGELLATAGSQRTIIVYKTDTYEVSYDCYRVRGKESVGGRERERERESCSIQD